MSRYDFQIPVTFKHRIVFTRDAFSKENPILTEILEEGAGRRAIVFVEQAVADAWPNLETEVNQYFAESRVDLKRVVVLPGGESVKSDDRLVRQIWEELNQSHIDRHSYALVIGGGAFLDAAGYATATAHRGVRLVRFPTTTLSQDDSGVGVKCAINGLGKKNWIGAFSVPYAVINDFRYLHSQPEEVKRAGLIEALKVALVKDPDFFDWIDANAESLAALKPEVLEACVERSALLHARHIATSGDPFETGSSRPLDFGHWAAHKLEAMSGYELFHAPAVAVGLALDTVYSSRIGLLTQETAERILRILTILQLPVWHPMLDEMSSAGRNVVFDGLTEFREHLGGELTVLLLRAPGMGVDMHEMDLDVLVDCIAELRSRV